jgi:[FeFe] hydrogenase H-cluster maturation GTPase HydF
MLNTPRANRLHISIFGRRNVGKSSLINAITGQQIALVSDVAGTTTDPVYKSMELLPIGPVVFIDTAGLDDIGEIGSLRKRKTIEVMDKTDFAILVFSVENEDISLERNWFDQLKSRNIPVIGVINKMELKDIDISKYKKVFNMPFIKVSAEKKQNIGKLKEMIQSNAPLDYELPTLLGDIIQKKPLVVLVTPQDIQAPKNRLILPQVQTIRDILDNDGIALTLKLGELDDIMLMLNRKPNLVITDSQVFHTVGNIIPEDVPLTSFSILMAKFKGDLDTFIRGAEALKNLRPDDRVLIAEACTHHPLADDIGREKLPRLMEKSAGGNLKIDIIAGADFPEDLSQYKLILHCGGCMFNRKLMLTRIIRASEQGIPITNYGLAFAYFSGILERATRVFRSSASKSGKKLA